MVAIAEDPFICKFLRAVLTRAGQTSMELDVAEGVRLLRDGQLHARVLITNRPAAFRDFAGNLALLYTTSCPEPGATQGFAISKTLLKPFQAQQVLEALRELSKPVIP